MSDGGWDLTGIPKPFWPYVFEALERINQRAFLEINARVIAALGMADSPHPDPWKVGMEIVAKPEPDPWKHLADTMVGSVTLHYVALHVDDQAMRERMQETALGQIEGAMHALRNLDVVYDRTVAVEE